MARNLSSAVVIFAILCLTVVLKADEDDLTSEYGKSYKDLAELASSPEKSYSPFFERAIRRSAWSKDEKRYLDPSDDKNIWNENQGTSFFGKDLPNLSFMPNFNAWDLKKFFEYFENLLYDANRNNNGSSNKSSNNEKTGMQNRSNKDSIDKSEHDVKNEGQNREKIGTLNKSADDGEMQNSATTDTLNSGNDERMKSFSNYQPSDNKQVTGNARNEMQNSTNEDTTDNSRYRVITGSQRSANIGTLNEATEDEEIHDISNKTPDDDDEKIQNFLNSKSLDYTQSTKNSKIKLRNQVDEDCIDNSETSIKTRPQNSKNTESPNNAIDDDETLNSATSNDLNKPSRDGEIEISSNNESQNNRLLAKESRTKIKNSAINSDKDVKDEIPNPTKTNYNDERLQYFSNNDTLIKPSDNLEIHNSLENESLNSRQQTENSENEFLNSTNENYSNTLTEKKETENPSLNGIQLEPTSVPKHNKDEKIKNEVTTNNYEDLKLNDIISEDTTANNMHEEEFDDYNDNEDEDYTEDDNAIENEDDNYTYEYNKNKNEDGDFYLINYDNDNEDEENVNDFEDDYTQENKNSMNENRIEDVYIRENKNNTDENKVKDDDLNKNISDNNGNKNSNISPSSEPRTTVDNGTTTFPKYINKSKPDQQNYSENQLSTNEIKNSDNVTSEAAESENITNKENTLPKFDISGGEFIDDFINNPQRKVPENRNELSNKTEEFIPNKNDTATTIQIPISEISTDRNSSPTFSSLNNNPNDQNLPFEQSQNGEINYVSLPNYNGGIKDISSQTVLNENSLQNIQNAFTSDGLSAPYAQQDKSSNEVPPFQKKQYYTDLPNIFADPQNDYVFTEPIIPNFESNHPSIESFYNNAPKTDIYRPEEIDSFQLASNKDPNFQNENNMNNQDAKTPDNIIDYNQQIEQKQPTFLQQEMIPNIQYIPSSDIPNSQNEPKYFTNYQPEISVNAPSIEKPVQNSEMLSNFVILNNLQFNPTFNPIHNQEHVPVNIENNLVKMNAESQDQPGAMAPQNQINETDALYMQNQSDSLLVQDNLSNYPEEILQQNEMKNIAVPDENKIISTTVPTNEGVEIVEFLVPQNDTNTSKGLPLSPLNVNLEHKPNEKTFSPVISEKPKTKITPDKPLNDESQKSININEAEVFDQEESNYDYYFPENDSYDESSSYGYDKEYEDDGYNDGDDDGDGNDDGNDDDDDYDDDDDDNNKTEQTTSISAETVNNATSQITQEPLLIYSNDITEVPPTFETQSEIVPPNQEEVPTTFNTQTEVVPPNQEEVPTTFNTPSEVVPPNQEEVPTTFETQSEVVPPNQEEKFNSILEYIYSKFSNNSLFQNLKDETF